MRPSWLRRPVLSAGLLLVVLATVVAIWPAASLGDSASPLNGLQLKANNHDVGSAVTITQNCAADHSGGTVDFVVNGLASGPYPGTFTESGTLTLGSEVDVNGLVAQAVTAVAATFTITSGTTTVSGTTQIDPSAPASGIPGQINAVMYCSSIDPNGGGGVANPTLFGVQLLYSATIQSPGGTFLDSGTTFLNFSDFKTQSADGQIGQGPASLLGLNFVSSHFGPVTADVDGDGIDDSIETSPGSFSDGTSYGSIAATGGNVVAISDAPAPGGVHVTVTGPGTGPAVLNGVCGLGSISLTAGSDAVLTCGSVKVQMASGTATIALEGGITTIIVPQGDTAKVTDLGNGSFTVANLAGTAPVSVTTNGKTSTVAAGATSTVAVLTPANLCQLTRTDVTSSPKYQALTAKQKQTVDKATQAVCDVIGQVSPKLSAKQKSALVAAYKQLVDGLAAQGWLAPDQAVTLKGLASLL